MSALQLEDYDQGCTRGVHVSVKLCSRYSQATEKGIFLESKQASYATPLPFTTAGHSSSGSLNSLEHCFPRVVIELPKCTKGPYFQIFDL